MLSDVRIEQMRDELTSSKRERAGSWRLVPILMFSLTEQPRQAVPTAKECKSVPSKVALME